MALRITLPFIYEEAISVYTLQIGELLHHFFDCQLSLIPFSENVLHDLHCVVGPFGALTGSNVDLIVEVIDYAL